jgi:hypothetical protein
MARKRSACLYCGTLVRAGKLRCRCGKAVVRVVADRFQLQELLESKSGVLGWRGWDELEHRPAFIRAALPSASPEVQEGVEVEARLLRELAGGDSFPKHITGGRLRETAGLYTVCEFVSGQTLSEAADALPPTKIIEMFIRALRPVQTLHERDYVVNNICPEHFMVARDGSVKLVNLRAVQPSGARSRGHGVAGYMAPEQFSHSEPLTPAADVFGLGCCLYLLLAGRLPYPAAGSEEVFRSGYTPQPPSSLNHGLIPAVDDVVMKALDRDPDRRFAYAGEMKDALWEAFAGTTIVDGIGPTFERSLPDRLRGIRRELERLDSFMVRAGHALFGRLVLRRKPVGTVHRTGRNAMRTISVVLLLSAAVGAGFYFLNRNPGEARLRVFAWPSVEVSVDGGKWVFEAPDPGVATLPAGRHTFIFESRNGQGALAVSVKLHKGKTHSFRVDLEKGRFTEEGNG